MALSFAPVRPRSCARRPMRVMSSSSEAAFASSGSSGSITTVTRSLGANCPCSRHSAGSSRAATDFLNDVFMAPFYRAAVALAKSWQNAAPRLSRYRRQASEDQAMIAKVILCDLSNMALLSRLLYSADMANLLDTLRLTPKLLWQLFDN